MKTPNSSRPSRGNHYRVRRGLMAVATAGALGTGLAACGPAEQVGATSVSVDQGTAANSQSGEGAGPIGVPTTPITEAPVSVVPVVPSTESRPSAAASTPAETSAASHEQSIDAQVGAAAVQLAQKFAELETRVPASEVSVTAADGSYGDVHVITMAVPESDAADINDVYQAQFQLVDDSLGVTAGNVANVGLSEYWVDANGNTLNDGNYRSDIQILQTGDTYTATDSNINSDVDTPDELDALMSHINAQAAHGEQGVPFPQ